MKPFILIVDDEQDRHSLLERKLRDCDMQHAYSYEDAVHRIKAFAGWRKRFDVIYLDHDLGPGKTGLDVVDYLTHNLSEELRPERVVVHSLNPVGADNMMRALQRAGIQASREPFNV